MTCDEATLEDIVQRVLHTSERLRRIVVLIVDVHIVLLHSITGLLRQQIVVDERLCGLRSELHHHPGGGVGIHVRILTRHVSALDVHNIEEHFTGLCLTGHAALMAVGDVLLSHILTARLHQLHLYEVLDLLHRHLTLATLGDVVCDLIQQPFILTLVSMEHGLTDGSHNLLLIESHDASVTLYYSLNHIYKL